MQNIRITGTGSISSGEYGDIKISGMAQGNGAIKADIINIMGKFKSTGSLDVKQLACSGAADVFSDIHAKQIEVSGMLNVTGGSKIEAEEIRCDGSIKVDGQICSDVLKVNGLVNAKEIVGDYIQIKSHFFSLAKFFFTKSTTADLIEATTIHLVGVTANTVNGCHITVGPECIIENLDCSGTLTIHPASRVKNVSGNYTAK